MKMARLTLPDSPPACFVKKYCFFSWRLLVLSLFFFLFSFPTARAGLSVSHETRRLMGTMVSVTVVSEEDGKKAINAAFSEMELVDRLMSTYKPSSDISTLNRSAGKKTVQVHPKTFDVIKRGIFWGGASGGAFDITVGKIKKLYRLDAGGDIPGRRVIENEMRSVGFEKVKLIKPDHVFLPSGDMEVDLGGIAKGYAVEQALLAIRKEGVSDAMVNAGGDIGAMGTRMGESWKIGILHPREKRSLLGVLLLKDRFVATSGDYMQFFERSGQRFTHIVDPASGKVSRGKMSVTVVAPSGADADALATTLFVLKKEEGLKLIEKIGNVEAMIVTRKGGIFYSSGFRGYLRQK